MKICINYLWLSIFTISFCYAPPIESNSHINNIPQPREIIEEWNNIKTYLKNVPLASLEITIPKSGTHLLSKCVCFLQGKKITKTSAKKLEGPLLKCSQTTKNIYIQKRQGGINNLIFRKIRNPYKPIGSRRVSLHLAHTTERETLVRYGAKKALLLIRDPRDQLISFANWVYPSSKAHTQDFNNLLLDFIDGKKHFEHHVVRMYEACNMMWSFGIAEFYKMYLPWMNVENVYTVRFENLIGEQGGGSSIAQIREIKAIAQHLNLPLTNEKIHAIARNLFGGTSTFNKGEIGTWKTVFTPEHKAAFKEAAGQLLIDLGYEKDLNW